MVASQRESIVFKIDPKLLQLRPPRLTLAATLNTLGQRVQLDDLDANVVVDILDENRLLPYMIRNIKNLYVVSLGQITNASKIGDIIVSEECIKGNYELCLAFLSFVSTIVKSDDYFDSSKTMLASVTYIANEIYPNHHIWTYRDINDMYKILNLCTDIFYSIIVKPNSVSTPSPATSNSPLIQTTPDPKSPSSKANTDPSEMELVCVINLSQNHSHKQLLDVIVEGKQTIRKISSEPEFKGEQSLKESPVVVRTRQSLSIFHRLLVRSEHIKKYHDSQVVLSGQHIDRATSDHSLASMTAIERALFDTTIRPNLLQHLFGYIDQKEDSLTACLVVDLIKKIAEKFSMSLMASLGSAADRVCEFFVDCLGNPESNQQLEIAIVNLLTTCVRHQPGLIELFINSDSYIRSDGDKSQTVDANVTANTSGQQKKSLEVVMNLLKECVRQQTTVHRSLHAHLMEFIYTFWEKNHWAVERFDKLDEFWDLITSPMLQFTESCNSVSYTETYTLDQALSEKLNSCALMILAREIFNVSVGVNDRKMNSKLKEILEGLASRNFLSKFSIHVAKRYACISSNPDKCDYYEQMIAGWRDFLASYSKYEPFETRPDVKSQIIENMLTCLAIELRLSEQLRKERLIFISDVILLTWTKWQTIESSNHTIFQSIHELLYLVDSCKEYVPFSFLLTFQCTLNSYLMRQRDYLKRSNRSFDLLVPAVGLMHFGMMLMEKDINDNQPPPAQTQDDKQQAASNQDSAHQTTKAQHHPNTTKTSIESRLCQASIMSLRFIIDVAQPHIDLWIDYLQTNLKIDYLIYFLTLLMTRKTGSEVCSSLVELLLYLSSLEQTDDYLNKATLISRVNIVLNRVKSIQSQMVRS